MNEAALLQLWSTYSDAWSAISTEERTRLLTQSVAPDVAFTSPDSDEHGISQLASTIADFQSKYAGFYFRTTLLRHQHGQLLITWTMFDPKHAPVVSGNSYARVDEQEGRLTYLAGFWKL